jgi:hypothetical protein
LNQNAWDPILPNKSQLQQVPAISATPVVG